MMLLGTGAVATKTFVDDIFATNVWIGDGSPHQVVNGIDLTKKEGLVWTKCRTHSDNHLVTDTVRGSNKTIFTDTTAAEQTSGTTYLGSFNNNGYTTGSWSGASGNGKEFVGWTFRKAPGFFDVVTYTGNGNTPQAIAHNLGSIPGMVIVKRTDSSNDWMVLHRSLGASSRLELNSDNTSGSGVWGSTEPTSTHFYVAGSAATGANGATYVAYLFAGGESTAATARSVDFGSSSYLSIPDHAHNWTFESNPFTIEMWVKSPDAHAGYETLVSQWGSSQQSWSVRYSSADVGSNWSFFYSSSGSNSFSIDGGAKIDDNQWHHIAVVRDSSKIKLYTDGKLTGSANHSNVAFHNSTADVRIGSDGANNQFTGSISNLRIIRSTAHYTSAFRVPTAPLPDTGRSAWNNIAALTAGTVLLCCNNSSVTGSTFSSGTISSSGSNVTASIDSPFDDPAGFVFGDAGDQNVIKCGSYVGNGSSTGPEINLGFEPQFLITKKTDGEGNWHIYDSMRGIVTGGNDALFRPNNNDAEETTVDAYDLTPTGFKVKTSYSHWNENNKNFLYLAIRRPDGYVGKPPELGTDVFAMDTGASTSANTIPDLDSSFPVDLALIKSFNNNQDWHIGTRLQGTKKLNTNLTASESNSSNQVWDSNLGCWKNLGSEYQGWMWKRHAGFDVVTYKGNGVARQISHNLSKTPEMIWIKNRTEAREWSVGHIGLDGGTNPWEHYIILNSSSDENGSLASGVNIIWGDGAPNATHFNVGDWSTVNENNKQHIAMLFASVDSISKCGEYDGQGSPLTITTGFAPRFLIIKRTTGTDPWFVLDTTRGWGSGNDNWLTLDGNGAQSSNDLGAPTSTGFTVNHGSDAYNNTGEKYIYYAHA